VLLLMALVALVLLAWWPAPAWGASGAVLFENHCVGCHVHGGNILRRSKTLKLGALMRNGIEGPEAVAAIAAGGIGQMGGYGDVLGADGPEAVGAWVWQQALQNWKAQPKAAPLDQNA
jgi:cytochrome c6